MERVAMLIKNLQQYVIYPVVVLSAVHQDQVRMLELFGH